MFIIFGIRDIKRELGITQNVFHCNHCNNDNHYTVTRVRKFFHIFWIPLIPLLTKYYVSCPVCDFGFEVEKDEADNLINGTSAATNINMPEAAQAPNVNRQQNRQQTQETQQQPQTTQQQTQTTQQQTMPTQWVHTDNNDRYYLAISLADGSYCGPITLTELRAFELMPDYMVTTEELNWNWYPASKFFCLADLFYENMPNMNPAEGEDFKVNEDGTITKLKNKKR